MCLDIRRVMVGLVLAAFVAGSFVPLSIARADGVVLPAPGTMLQLSPSFDPPMLKGLKVHPNNPFRFDFVLSQGDSTSPKAQRAKGDFLKVESNKLIKYFLAGLTIPEQDLWVNLSPYEKNRIVPGAFGQTQMSRDLLAEDYILKQISASLTYPEGQLGKEFWKEVYKKVGTASTFPINTFNKVWIVPDKAIVYENSKAGTAYVVKATLKVMLEEDYLALKRNSESARPPKGVSLREDTHISSNIIRKMIIPELTKEVNEGKNFAQLRQVYNSLILAAWYKKKIKASILATVYANKNKTAGLVPLRGGEAPEAIYEHYLEAFKKGAYNLIKEEIDPVTQQLVPRKYFSGGVVMNGEAMDNAMVMEHDRSSVEALSSSSAMRIDVQFDPAMAPRQGPMSGTKLIHDQVWLGSRGSVAQFLPEAFRGDWFKAGNNGLYHSLEHSILVAEAVYSSAIRRGVRRSDARFLKEVAYLHDFHPRQPGTPAVVADTLNLLDQDWEGKKSLDHRPSSSFLRRQLHWTTQQYEVARAIILRSQYPSPDPKQYKEAINAIEGSSSGIVRNKRISTVMNGSTIELRSFALREGYFFTILDQMSWYLFSNFQGAISVSKALTQERRNIGQDVSDQDELARVYNFMQNIGSGRGFDQGIAKELGIEVTQDTFAPRDDVLASLPKHLRDQFQSNMESFSSYLGHGKEFLSQALKLLQTNKVQPLYDEVYVLRPNMPVYHLFLHYFIESMARLPLNNEVGRTHFFRSDAQKVIEELKNYFQTKAEELSRGETWAVTPAEQQVLEKIFEGYPEVFKNIIYPLQEMDGIGYNLELIGGYNPRHPSMFPIGVRLERRWVEHVGVGKISVHENGSFKINFYDGTLELDLGGGLTPNVRSENPDSAQVSQVRAVLRSLNGASIAKGRVAQVTGDGITAVVDIKNNDGSHVGTVHLRVSQKANEQRGLVISWAQFVGQGRGGFTQFLTDVLERFSKANLGITFIRFEGVTNVQTLSDIGQKIREVGSFLPQNDSEHIAIQSGVINKLSNGGALNEEEFDSILDLIQWYNSNRFRWTKIPQAIRLSQMIETTPFVRVADKLGFKRIHAFMRDGVLNIECTRPEGLTDAAMTAGEFLDAERGSFNDVEAVRAAFQKARLRSLRSLLQRTAGELMLLGLPEADYKALNAVLRKYRKKFDISKVNYTFYQNSRIAKRFGNEASQMTGPQGEVYFVKVAGDLEYNPVEEYCNYLIARALGVHVVDAKLLDIRREYAVPVHPFKNFALVLSDFRSYRASSAHQHKGIEETIALWALTENSDFNIHQRHNVHRNTKGQFILYDLTLYEDLMWEGYWPLWGQIDINKVRDLIRRAEHLDLSDLQLKFKNFPEVEAYLQRLKVRQKVLRQELIASIERELSGVWLNEADWEGEYDAMVNAGLFDAHIGIFGRIKDVNAFPDQIRGLFPKAKADKIVRYVETNMHYRKLYGDKLKELIQMLKQDQAMKVEDLPWYKQWQSRSPYEDNHVLRPVYWRAAKRALGRFMASNMNVDPQEYTGRILYASYGKGLDLVHLKEIFPKAEITGIDWSPDAYVNARALQLQGVSVKLADIKNLHQVYEGETTDLVQTPLADKSFDMVITAGFMELLSSRDIVSAVKEIERVLKPGAFFMLGGLGPEQASLVTAQGMHQVSSGRSLYQFFKKSDRAMNAGNLPDNPATTARGGIDLTKANIDATGNQSIHFHIDPAQLAQWQKAAGIEPTILSIQPIQSVREFLGA